ncbi:MAG: LptE family protein [Bacteroidetes bacterium]|nr:LptE family protein [Bacteroidota bacterium]
MKRAFKYCLLSIVCCLLAFSSCKVHYSFSGASVSPDVKTVSIQTFKNNASLAPPTLSQSLTEAVKDIFTSQTNLGIVSQSGDLSFEGEITNYITQPVAIQSNDQAALNRLTITVHILFTNAKDEKQNFETSFARYSDYSSTQSLTSVQESLIEDINKQLVQDIFNKAMVNW